MTLLSDNEFHKKRIIATGGKGGVGKTTLASALALYFAEQEGKETLVVSSDPTPSLSDILEQNLGSKLTKIKAVPNLSGHEMKREEIVEAWKRRFGDEMYEVIRSYLPVDREIIDYIAEAPGVCDEQYTLAYLLDIYETGEYDKIIWDTAPAGATLSLLKLESRFYEHLTDAANLYIKMRSIFERMGEKFRIKKRRSALDIINNWKNLADHVMATLRNHDLMEFVVVTIAEGLGVSQTGRVVTELNDYGISVRNIVVNNVIPEETVGDSAFLNSRYQVQRSYVDQLTMNYADMLTIVPLLPNEVKGINALRTVYGYLGGDIKIPTEKLTLLNV